MLNTKPLIYYLLYDCNRHLISSLVVFFLTSQTSNTYSTLISQLAEISKYLYHQTPCTPKYTSKVRLLLQSDLWYTVS